MIEYNLILRLRPEEPVEVDDDNPYVNDHLGFKSSVQKVADLFGNIETPFTMGIYGDWGCGKTSFMKMLQAELKNSGNFETFWFDAWEYENETSLMIPMLSMMAKEIRGNKKIINSVKKIATTVATTAAITGAGALLKATTLDTVKVKDIMNQLDAYEKKYSKVYEKWVDQIGKLKMEFKKMAENIVGDKNALVIFIDDLDRCLPEHVIKLIENIKHFFTIQGCKCIFVLGVDKNVLEKSIQARYGSNLISGMEYLKKIINISFDVPKVNTSTQEYILKTAMSFVSPKSYNDVKDDVKAKNKVENDITEMAELIASFGIDNPRQLRPIVYRSLYFLSLDTNRDYIPEVIIRLIILKETLPTIYQDRKLDNNLLYPMDLHFNDKTISNAPIPMEKATYTQLNTRFREDIARIINSKENLPLLLYTEEIKFVISNCFNAMLSCKSIIEDLYNRDQNNALYRKARKIVNEYTKFRAKEYFEMVDFLFSLS